MSAAAVAGLFAAHQQPTLRDPGIKGVLPTAMIAIAQSGQRLCTVVCHGLLCLIE